MSDDNAQAVEKTFEAEKNAALAQLADLRDLANKGDEEIKIKEKELAEVRKEAENAQSRITIVESGKAAMENKMNDSQRLYKSEVERNAILERQIGRLKEENRALINEDDDDRIDKLKQRVAALEAEIKIHVEEKSTIESQTKHQEDIEKAAADATSKLRSENDTLRLEIQAKELAVIKAGERYKVSSALYNSSKGQLEALNQRSVLLTEQMQEFQKKLGEKDNFVAETESKVTLANTEVEKMKGLITDKDNEIVAVKGEVGDRDKLLKVAEEKATNLEEQLGKMSKDLDKAQKDLKAIKIGDSQQKSKMLEKEKTITTILAEKAAAEEELVSSKEAVIRLEEQADVNNGGDKALDNPEVKALKDANEAKEIEIKKAEQNLKEKQDLIRKLSGQVQKLETEIVPNMQADLDATKAKLGNADAEVKQKDQALKESMEARDKASKMAVSAEDRARQAEKKMTDLTSDNFSKSQGASVDKKNADSLKMEYQGLQKKFELASAQATELAAEKEKLDKEVEKLTSELTLVKNNSLAENRSRVNLLDDQLAASDVTVKGQQARLDRMTEQAKTDREVLLKQTEELGLAKEKISNLADIELQAKEDEISMLKEKINRMNVMAEERDTRISMVQEKYMSQKEELKMRVEQIRLLFDKLRGKEEELRITTDRSSFLDSQIKTEQAILKGAEERLEATQSLWSQTKEDLTATKARVKELEVEIETANDALENKDGELELATGEAERLKKTVESKDKRIQMLHDKVAKMRENMQGQNAKETKAAGAGDASKEEITALQKELDEAKESIAAAEEKASSQEELLAAKDLELQKAQTEAKSAEDQAKVLEDRVASSKDDVAKQIEHLEGKVKEAEDALLAKGAEVDKTIAEMSKDDSSLTGDAKVLSDKLARTEGLVKAKESLVGLLTEKLSAANLMLKAKEVEMKGEVEGMGKRLADAESEAETKLTEATAASEELALAQTEVKEKEERMNEVNIKLAEAEQLVSAKEAAIKKLEGRYEELKTTTDQEREQAKAKAEAAAGDPEQRAETAALEEELAAAKKEYFKTIALLFKTQLFDTGQMNNVMIEDLYEEIMLNDIQLSEWPTYIFSRSFMHA